MSSLDNSITHRGWERKAGRWFLVVKSVNSGYNKKDLGLSPAAAAN